MKTKNFDLLAKKLLTEEQFNSAKIKAKIRAKILIGVAENVKKSMINQNIGFNEFARIIGTSSTQLNRVLNGNTNLTINSLIKICIALHLEPEIKFKKIS